MGSRGFHGLLHMSSPCRPLCGWVATAMCAQRAAFPGLPFRRGIHTPPARRVSACPTRSGAGALSTVVTFSLGLKLRDGWSRHLHHGTTRGRAREPQALGSCRPEFLEQRQRPWGSALLVMVKNPPCGPQLLWRGLECAPEDAPLCLDHGTGDRLPGAVGRTQAAAWRVPPETTLRSLVLKGTWL